MITLINVPPEWKRRQRRAQCPHCKAEQWTSDGTMPLDHDRPDGRICHALRRASDSFWMYQVSTATPEYEDLPDGMFKRTRDQWHSLSPGMRREIVRSAKKIS